MRCVAVRTVVAAEAPVAVPVGSEPAGGRRAPPGNSRGCPAGGAGARRARGGGGAPWRAAGQRGTERPASPPGDSDPDSSSCQTGDGHRLALAGGSVFLRGDAEERGAAAAGGERPAPPPGESPPAAAALA